jgi:omega-6 fatty acid desaturase / acyl-lipid omega-6 desaturase (Delta-12 desaturase)
MAPRSAVVSEEVSPRKSFSKTKSAAIQETTLQRDEKGLPIFPREAPNFTLADIRNAIPKHCFERSALKSLSYVAIDAAISLVLFYCASTFITEAYVPALWMRAILWPIFWYALGTVLTGIWVLAHECGHQSFSDSQFINDSVGMVLHSFLLVPYFSWKYSHAAQ